jgi:hypothetical protein
MAGSSDFTIEIDERTYGDLRRELGEMPGAVDRAVVSAVNKTLSQGRTLIVDRLFALLNVKRGEIRKRVTVPHNGKATRDKPEGKIKIGKSRMGLINFGAKDTRTRKGKGAFGTAAAGRGVDVQVYRQGESANFPRAFIARYRGKATVLQRKQGTVLKPTGQKTSYGTDIKQRVQLTPSSGASRSSRWSDPRRRKRSRSIRRSRPRRGPRSAPSCASSASARSIACSSGARSIDRSPRPRKPTRLKNARRARHRKDRRRRVQHAQGHHRRRRFFHRPAPAAAQAREQEQPGARAVRDLPGRSHQDALTTGAPNGTIFWKVQFALEIHLIQSEKADDAIDTLINYAVADVQRALMSDPRRGENAHDTILGDPKAFDDTENSYSGVFIPFEVQYGHLLADPTTPI